MYFASRTRNQEFEQMANKRSRRRAVAIFSRVRPGDSERPRPNGPNLDLLTVFRRQVFSAFVVYLYLSVGPPHLRGSDRLTLEVVHAVPEASVHPSDLPPSCLNDAHPI
ncbi:hypothetical protein HYPSUDRAFT_275175 [Hypholoma sublateritium FD-334 SS-4]|uniref:Uncharacterized protein n=1 Tax=Hypholoma sublateritium (strain FD-334 SS-4) TaxID=945553 RepID=A0A0D2P684_HYPSF|nr:hypothetical protein HYPSUDRAFT_275175 [Hypholoma sublateritium FD-334 SS-4]